MVGNVVQLLGRGGQFNGVIRWGQRLVVLARIEVGNSQAYLQIRTVGSERRTLLQFCDGQVVFMPFLIHGTQVGMGELVERIVLQLLVEGLDRVVVLALIPVNAAQVVVGELVIGIDFNLLLITSDRLPVLAHLEIYSPQIVPSEFVLGIDFGRALQKCNRYRQVAAVISRLRTVNQIF